MFMTADAAVIQPHRQVRPTYRCTAAFLMRDITRMSTLAERISERLEILGVSPRAASLKAGLSADAIRNILRGKSVSARADTLAAIARALGCDVRYLLGETDEVGEASESLGELKLPVRYVVGAGAWRETDDSDQVSRRFAPAQHIPGYDQWPQWLEEIEGDSINRLIPPGALIHVAGIFGYTPRNDDLVVVVRTRAGGMLQERTVKQVELTPEGVKLWPRSFNDRWKDALVLSDGLGDGEDATVEIAGKVLRAYIGFDAG